MQTPTIAEASALIAARQLSPVELVAHCLARIEARERELNSFVTVTAERALQDAKAAERRMMSGSLRGRLDGIPIAHKDIFATQGIRTTAQSKLLQDWLPQQDAHLVQALAAAGTSMLGKTATHEFALGGPPFDLPWPPARNPWNSDHYASGSSSGTAVALAAGMILGGTGTDTAGSIRSPAALCGITGLKPTFGLCSRRGVIPLSSTLDHAGPMARTVQDCAILLQAMAGHDADDPASIDQRVPDFSLNIGRNLKGLRIGVASSWHAADHVVRPAVQAGIDEAVEVWRADGAQISELALPPLGDYQAANFVMMVSEAYAMHETSLRSRFRDYGELLRSRLVLGALMTGSDYLHALRQKRRLMALTLRATADVDLIVTACASAEAPRIQEVPRWNDISHPSFYAPFNTTGWPAMTVPFGRGPQGLPLAIQVAAKPFQESQLFQVAHAFERSRK